MFEYQILGMTCGGCARSITAVITAVDPDARVQADPATKRVSVQSRASDASLRAALAEAGYPVTA